jgi:hypothetical protein
VVRDRHGAVLEYQGVGFDITDRRRAEEMFRESMQTARGVAAQARAAADRERRAADEAREVAEFNRRLALEVDHRVRNNLAGLLSLVGAMREKSKDVRSFAGSIEGRLLAMTHVHEVLAETDWRAVDLESDWPELGVFDAVLMFNYLDRKTMSRIVDLVAPGGVLMMETFLTTQRAFGWGPSNEDHLLRMGEIRTLALPLEVVHGREVIEPVDTERWRAVAGVVAERKR